MKTILFLLFLTVYVRADETAIYSMHPSPERDYVSQSKHTSTLLSSIHYAQPQPRINRIVIDADKTRQKAESWVKRHVEHLLPPDTYLQGASIQNGYHISIVYRF